MVISHDPFIANETMPLKSKVSLDMNPAPRLDRIAANLVDTTIVITFAKVFAAKAIYSLRVAINFDLDQSLLASAYNILWLTFSVQLIYMALTHRLLGRTIGQALFSLKTVSLVNTKPMDQYTLVSRTFLTFVSVFLVFPILSILTNRDGRTFYDKIFETLVVSDKPNTKRTDSFLPLDKLLGSSLVLILFVFLSYMSLFFAKNTLKFKSDFVKNSKVCKAITDIHQIWTDSKIEESRLDVALAMYSAGELSVECLSKEIEFEFSVNSNSATAFFAKGLISIENDTKFIKYFKKACAVDPNSSACLVSSWMSFWPNFYEGEVQKIDFSHHPTFVKIWAIKRNHQKGNILQLAKILNEMQVPHGMEGFYTEHLLRVKYFTNDTKSFEGVLKIAENRNLRPRKLSELYCSIAVSENCEAFAKVKNCNSLTINRETDSHLQNMYYACKGLARNIFSSNTDFENYYLKIAKKEKPLLNELKNIFTDTEASFALRYSSLNTFFNEIANIDYLIAVKQDWESSASKDFIWRLTGEKLKAKFISLNDLQQSFQVFKKLASEFEEVQNKADFLDSFKTDDRSPAQSELNGNAESKGP